MTAAIAETEEWTLEDEIFRTLEQLHQLLQQRNICPVGGFPLSQLTMADPIIGATRDGVHGTYLEHNEVEEGPYVDCSHDSCDGSSIVSVKRFGGAEHPPDVSVYTTHRLPPRWLRSGTRVQFVVERHEDGEIRAVGRSVLSETAMRLKVALETTRIRHQGTLARTERIARKKLEEHLTAFQSDCYEVDGSFFEYSTRSHIHYLLRKSRPTLALRVSAGGYVRPLCALCLHTYGYHADTWASTMSPSDELLATLLLIRTDEHELWKRAGQHPLDDYTSGV